MSNTVAQLSSDTKIAISLKKLQGKAHTKTENELYNEGLPSGITMDSSTVFGSTPPANPTTTLWAITGGIVEKVRLTCTFIAGSDTPSGKHGYKLSLPSNYESTSTNSKKGSAPFTNGAELVSSNGLLQLVPPSFDYRYEAVPYHGSSSSLVSIPLADPRDWNLDYFNGVYFQQDPPTDTSENPTFIDAYLYIGDFLDTVVSNAGGGGAAGIIGDPEDGTWNDGLGVWNDFTNNTPTGTAIDRINEFLKGLAPSAAGNLSTSTVSSGNGVGVRLSFGAANAVGTHTNVGTLDNFSSLDVNGNYAIATNTDHRLGAFGVLANVQGVVNGGASGDGTNYPPNAFGNANLGTLQLEVNGSIAYTLDLTDNSTGAGTSGSGTSSHLTNGTGFYNVSAATSGKFLNGGSLAEYKHRTALWQVGTAAQRPGWNYVKVLHVIGSTTYRTNHVQWLNDVSGTSSAISISSNAISGLSLTGSNHLSGIEYYTGGTLTYACVVGNFYKNVYDTTSMEISSSQCQNVNVVPGAIDTSNSEDENKTIAVSENLTINSTKLLNESISVGINVPHPLKSNIANGGSTSVNNILLYNIAESNTDTLKTTENFNGESFRLKIGPYATQANVTSSSNDYDSTVSLVGNTGLQVWNQRLVAPIRSTNSGNFSAIGNGPSGNPDYSSLTTGSKYYYRKFTNNTGGSTSNFTLVIQGTGTIVSNDTTLDGDKIQVFLKLPGPSANTTGWMDISIPFQPNNYADNDGCLVEAFDSSLDSTILGTIGTKFVENNEHIVIKIVAAGSWTGHISELRIIWR